MKKWKSLFACGLVLLLTGWTMLCIPFNAYAQTWEERWEYIVYLRSVVSKIEEDSCTHRAVQSFPTRPSLPERRFQRIVPCSSKLTSSKFSLS